MSGAVKAPNEGGTRDMPDGTVCAATMADPVVDLDSRSLYLNRELSLLAFQERVLEEAEDPSTPLLERAKFLAIFSSNLAEFYMVRLAGLRQQVMAGVRELSLDGLTPAEQLRMCRERSTALLDRARRGFEVVKRGLAEAGVSLYDYDELDEAQRADVKRYFDEQVFPVLTPLAFDPARPFPHISNLSLNLAVLIKDTDGEERFARVKIPRALARLVPVCEPKLIGPACAAGADRLGRTYRFVWLEQLIVAHIGTIFPGVEVVEAHPFRVTRDAEYAIQELEAEDLLDTIEEGVRRRRFGSVVRVTVTPDLPPFLRDVLIENLDLQPEDIVSLRPPIGMSNLMQLYAIDRPDLKDPPFRPAMPPGLDRLASPDMFAVVRERDVLLHRPYDSFEPLVRLLQQAAVDPDVLAIKITLYRVGRDAPVVEALLDAAENDKEVAVLLELKARFDEESNIGWARKLEQAGAHVVYGVIGLKTHTKVALIVRREGDRIVRYVHVGTGNYNVVTATQYTDLDLLTADPAMGEDASQLFNYVTGYSHNPDYERFLVAPLTARAGIANSIEREIAHAEAGRPAGMVLMMNALVDLEMSKLLYRASMAGVSVDLIVRGMCILRPGVPGISENIRVRSIVGRFLEHPRIYYFDNDDDPSVFIGSADLMRRNLDRRVEVLAPVLDPGHLRYLRDVVLQTYLDDNVRARVMHDDGTYSRAVPEEGSARVDAQERLMRLSAEREAGGEQ
jgi:polyphosphate kinase